MLRSARRAGAVAGLLSLAVVTALGGAATAAPQRVQEPVAGHGRRRQGLRWLRQAQGRRRGLDNPRGIGFGPDGALYVAESGSGGAGRCMAGPEGADVCFGRSGGVAATGPVDLGFSGWTGYLLVGNPGGGTESRERFGPAARRFGKLLKVDLHGIRSMADFPRFEELNNPDGGAGVPPGEPGAIDSNPNGLLVRKGARFVTDAGGNDVLEIATGGLLNTPPDQLPAGRLVRVNRDGSQTTLASEGLNAPGGFVLGHGAAYITNNSILSDAGQVVKVAV
jgi:hypothetical protein